MNETFVTVQGRLVADPERKVGGAGTPFTVFRIASTVRRPARNGGYEDGGTSFYSVVAFRALAANAARSLKKGDPVVVMGRQRINEFVRQDDSRGTSVEIDARAIGHDLTFGTTEFAKVVAGQYTDDEDRMGNSEVQDAIRSQSEQSEGERAGNAFDPSTDDYVVNGASGSASAERVA